MTMRRSIAVAAIVASWALGLSAPNASAFPVADGSSSQTLQVQYLGQTNVAALAEAARSAPMSSSDTEPPRGALRLDRPVTSAASGRAALLQLGHPNPLPVSGHGSAQAFDGIDHTDSRLADNGNQISGEPPDGDLCAGSQAEVEILNDALQFFDPLGNVLTPPIANNQFMGIPPEIARTPTGFTFPGPRNSDINCAYDSTTGRFFLMTWGLDQDLTGGFLTGTQAYYIAAQATPDPLGAYNLFKLPVESPSQPECHGLCLADYPQSSTDANSYLLTYDRFDHDANRFRGGRIIVLSKHALLTGHLGPASLINPGRIGGALTAAFLGAQVVPGSAELISSQGTHYFVATLDPTGAGSTQVGLVALTNTAAIDSNDPSAIHVQTAVVPGVLSYAFPPKLTQKPGPRPLGSNLAALFPGAPNEPLRQLDGGADWAQPAKFADGQIWTVIDTQLATGNSGLLWLAIKPTLTPTSFGGAVTHQGYLGVATNNLDYGDIAVTPDGSTALIVASLVGPTSFPSAVYTTFSTTAQPAALHMYLAGVRPEDGVTCYDAYIPGDSALGCRWGDYSMANISPSGVFWFETEYITPRARKLPANWGTAIGRLPS
ncbi:MAG: hypothetical protein QOG97_1223 [Acidimicrobiaceae bacterium]|nr:hypothetical protein [Acidimicrobiaceae bacterium]